TGNRQPITGNRQPITGNRQPTTMKTSTLLLLLVSAIGGVAIYFFEIKPGKPRDEVADKTKPAFTFSREDITAITLTPGGKTVNLENQNNKWVITAPLNAPADESAMNSLIGDLVNARIDREFSGGADALKSFGLAEPAVKLEIKLKNGQTHRVELGTKDVVGALAYAKINGAQNVSMVTASMLTSADKPINDLRNRSILGATQFEIGSLKITNESGSFEIAKQDAEWKLKSPVEGNADESAINTLLSDLTAAKASGIVSETADDLAKYGLDKSKLSVSAKLSAGTERTINI